MKTRCYLQCKSCSKCRNKEESVCEAFAVIPFVLSMTHEWIQFYFSVRQHISKSISATITDKKT